VLIFNYSFILVIGVKVAPSRINSTDMENAKIALKKELMTQKIAEFQTLERTEAFISTDLYWKYDTYCREMKYSGAMTWGAWLEKQRAVCVRQFEMFREQKREREALCALREARKKTVVRYISHTKIVNCVRFNS
jgi:hypothetical protein